MTDFSKTLSPHESMSKKLLLKLAYTDACNCFDALTELKRQDVADRKKAKISKKVQFTKRIARTSAILVHLQLAKSAIRKLPKRA
jgi:hypothetical protein